MDKLDQIENDFALWVDEDVIAETVIDKMAEYGMEITLANAKAVWLDALEHLPQLVRASVQALKEKTEE